MFEDDLDKVAGNPERAYVYTIDFDAPTLEPADFRIDNLQPID
jgi:hypothetical protein